MKTFCFCTLALGGKYHIMASKLAESLHKYGKRIKIVILSDRPKHFKELNNVIAFKHKQRYTLKPYNDKLFVLRKALSLFDSTVFIDADTFFIDELPDVVDLPSGLVAGSYTDLVPHVKKYTPERLPHYEKIASKINMSLSETKWVGEALFGITRDNGKEKEYLKIWEKLANYLELRKVVAGVGSPMGMAAQKVGWAVHSNGDLEKIAASSTHIDASLHCGQNSHFSKICKRIGYHYRFNRLRLRALKDTGFYYR